MKWKSLILGVMILFSNLFLFSADVHSQGLQVAGATDLGTLYVDTAKTGTLQKAGAHYLTVFAEEKYTDRIFLAELRKDEDLKDVVDAIYLYLFDNRSSSYYIAVTYLVDAQGKVCLDYGSDVRIKRLTAKGYNKAECIYLVFKGIGK